MEIRQAAIADRHEAAMRSVPTSLPPTDARCPCNLSFGCTRRSADEKAKLDVQISSMRRQIEELKLDKVSPLSPTRVPATETAAASGVYNALAARRKACSPAHDPALQLERGTELGLPIELHANPFQGRIGSSVRE